MKIAREIEKQLEDKWIPSIYKIKVRGQRTRAHSLAIPEKENHSMIQYTLLGIELKVGRSRFSCPDLSSARYIQIFASIGCRDFAVPYDISRIAGLADELESSWHKMLLLVESESVGKSPQTRGRMRAGVIRQVRNQIKEIGAGEKMPAFNTNTKQR